VRMAGFDAESNLDLGHGFSLYSSYSYTQSKVKQDLYLPATVDTAAAYYATEGKQFPGTPRNMSYIGARYSQNGLTLNLNGKFTGSEYGDFLDSERVASNFTVNGSVSYELPDFSELHKTTIALNALNILNRHYLALPSSPTIDAAESSPTYFVGAPRQWYLTISTTLF
jgi:iron complex outermembrane receptor protein